MKWDFKRYKARKEQEEFVEKATELYGENAPVMMKSKQVKKESTVVHSFPHLLNKRFTVKQLNLPVFNDYARPVNNYPITERDKVNRLLRNGAKEKTFLDD